MLPSDKKEQPKNNQLMAMVINIDNDKLTVKDENDGIYTFNSKKEKLNIGDVVVIEYAGLLDKTKSLQNNSLINISPVSQDEEEYFYNARSNNGLFSQFSTLASNKLKTMSLDEKIGQILLVKYPDANAEEALKKYHFAGYVFFEKDFRDKSEKDVQDMMSNLQKVATTPILTTVDEEGGTVVRISSNPNLVASKFLSPRELYQDGGFDAIKDDVIEKDKILSNLGINVNLAPVVDVSTNPDDYMYDRTLGEDTELTSTYAKTVIEASKGSKVSYVLKHFPGYGDNDDTHAGEVLDNRSKESIETNDLPPFEAGIQSQAEAILVSHNTVVNIDNANPASLSPSIHNLLRNNLGFTGVIMTDDLSMGATSSIDNAVVKALLAGNDLIMVTDYENSINELKDALEDGTISEELIDNAAHKVLSWKYYKGLMSQNQK